MPAAASAVAPAAASDSIGDALDYGAVLAPRDTPAPARSVHLAQLGRALTDPGMAPPITWMLVYNLNPVVTLPNQNLVIEGLKREDLFTVVHEQFMTDTARYADIVLPATTQYEQWELMGSWGQTYLAINPPAIAPLGEAVANSELFRRLSRALGMNLSVMEYVEAARLRGEENADRMRPGSNMPEFLANNSGGIAGGISTGQPVVVRVAFKPTSSILTPVETITREGEATEIVTKGRHDPCVGIRGAPVVEAMMALVLADHAAAAREAMAEGDSPFATSCACTVENSYHVTPSCTRSKRCLQKVQKT